MDSSSSNSSNTQTPNIRTFQMDGSSQGTLASSVNLFRGDVNLNKTLFSLPGRSPEGLDVSIAIQYQSNVFHDATTWNQDAPTGILGLGWDLPLTYIEAVSGASPVAATRQYVFYDNGASNQLFRQPLVPILFTMSSSLASGLVNGAPLPSAIVGQFRNMGLAISTSAVVHGAGPWTLSDDALMQTFALDIEGTSLVARDGGELYQLQNYQFWKVLYYPAYERWLVVSDQGVRRSFGGQTASTSNGFATSLGNSIAWSVYWNDANGRPTWTGPCGSTSGQAQVARAWYLYETRDRFGSAITNTYNGGARSSTGIIPLAEQQVGTGGKPYTKAVYLNTITDTIGRTIQFVYGAKLWESASTSPREYHDPHCATPSNNPGPYQDRYETQYLAGITVSSAYGNPMYSFTFDYSPRPQLSGPERAVANVTTYTDSRQGDTYKRLLTSVTQRNQDGVASPSLRFTYDLGANTTGGQPGALLSITEPSGGTASYTYLQQQLPICNRALTANRPSGVANGAAARIFYGTDYAVVCFYNQNKQQLSLEVYTWTGQWLHWAPSTSALIDSQGFTLSSLMVYAQADFLAVSFNRTNGDLPLYIYQRDTARPGQWIPATVDGVTTAQDTPTRLYKALGNLVQIQGGNTFLAILNQTSMSTSPYKGSYDVLTWRWTTQSTQGWTRTTTSLTQYCFMTAGPEWLALLGKNGTLNLAYLDGTLAWQQSATIAIGGLQTSDPTAIQLTAGAGLLVIANLLAASTQQNRYNLVIAQWNADYTITTSQHGSYLDIFGTTVQGAQNPPLPWTPTVFNDSLIAVNGNVLRRVGSTWQENTSLNPGNPLPGTSQRFAYGTDVAIRVLVTGLSAQAVTVAYDPTVGAFTPATSTYGGLPAQSSSNDNWPFANSDDWLFVGPYAWFRGTATAWTQTVSQAPTCNFNNLVSGTFNSASLVNQAPGFVAFPVVDKKSNQDAQAITLRNGNADLSSVFLSEQLSLPSSSGPGSSSAGPQLFASFSAQSGSFDQAQSVTIRRYAGYDVQGPITHYTVSLVQMNDGFGDAIPTSYNFDVTTAAADVAGEVAKFYTSTTYPGSTTTSSAPYGSVVSQYLNGVADQPGNNFYDMLDGMLVGTAIYGADGTLLESKTCTWNVLQQAASSPTDPTATPVQLRGGFVVKTSEVALKDGLTTTTSTGYTPSGFAAPINGQPLTRSRLSMNGAGIAEVFTQTVSHGVQYYSNLWAIHALNDVAQVVSTQASASVKTLLSSKVNTYSTWASSTGDGVFSPAPAAAFALRSTNQTSFPFSTWVAGQTPAGWVPITQVTSRGPWGHALGSLDPLGVGATTIYDNTYAMAVATIENALPGECAYFGFQSYENQAGWGRINPALDTTNAYTGTQSAILSPNGISNVNVTVTPTRADTFVVGCRYLTPVGFVGNGSGLEAHVYLGGSQTSVVTLPWAATNGAWAYVTLPVTVSTIASGASIQVLARNTTASSVHVGSILVAPLVSAVTVRTFDPDSQQVLSSTDAGGRTSRTAYTRSYRPTASIGVTGLVRELSSSFLSRRGSTTDSFDPSSPNAEVTLHSAQGGVLETFCDGGQWPTRWQPASSTDWSVSNGALVHTYPTASQLTWTTTPAGTYAIYFEPQTSDPSAVLSLLAGDIQVKWGGSGWTAKQGTVAWTRLAAPSTIANQWLLVVGAGVVSFFGDGQLLFSQLATPSSKAVSLTITGNVSVRNLTGVQDVRLGLSYNDTGNRQRQVHQLCGSDSQVCALVYDAIDRRIATTRSAPGSFGSGATMAPLAYRPGFLNVAAFLAATTSTWQMSGDIAAYYQGPVPSDSTRSNDQGYPYHGVRYEASPRSVKLETSLPGQAFAINLQVDPTLRQTTQYSYGVNASAVGSMPQGQYSETRVTSPVKSVSSRLTDRLEQQMGMRFLDSTGATASQSVASRSYAASATGPTASLVQQTPNAQLSAPPGNSAAFVRTLVQDARKQTISFTDCDTGTTSFIYDSAGNLRFVEPALSAGEQWYIYYKYDAIGRRIEEGTVTAAWNAATLQQNADNRLLPSSSDPTVTPLVTTQYDGAGNDPSLIGRKSHTTSKNPAPTSVKSGGGITVKEDFTYGADGNVATITQTISGAVSQSGVIGQAFNSLGELVRTDLPSGCPIASIFYGYDDHGDIVRVGKTSTGAEFGTFRYNADRQVQSFSVADWNQVITYTSQNWVQSIVTSATASAQFFSLNYTYQPDGVIQSRSATYSFTPFNRSYNDTFTYDSQRRLSGANGDSNSQFTSYDPNGNLFTAIQAGMYSSFQCAPGSNQLSAATIAGVAQSAPTYNARGEMVSGLGRSLEYIPGLGRTRAITTGTAQVALAYGGVSQRVVKQNLLPSPGRVNVYFHGAGRVPVASLINGKWGVTVYGPLGPIAYVSDNTYYLLSDTTQSVWGAVANGALSFATAWTPFGTVGASYGDATVVPYGYQGHEWDSEVGLYNFGARLYDPTICRFLTPDPRAQFCSPYLFAGNNPLSGIDPTGELSLWARIGIGLGMAAIALAGTALTIATGGAAAPSVIALEAMSDAALAGGTSGAAVAGAEVSVAAGAAGAEVAAGASSASLFSASAYAQVIVGSTIAGAGTAGLQYDVRHGRSFTAKGFGEAVGIGAASGLASGALGGLLTPAANLMGETALQAAAPSIGLNIVKGAIFGGVQGASTSAVGAAVSTMLTNAADHKPWYQNLGKDVLHAAAEGFVTGFATGGIGMAWTLRRPILEKGVEKGVISHSHALTIEDLPTLAKEAAMSDAGRTGILAATFLVGMGWLEAGVISGNC